MSVLRVVHQVYMALRQLPVCVQAVHAAYIFIWQVQGDRLGAVVPMRTPGVRQFRSCQMTHSVRLNCHERFGSRTPSVYGDMGPPCLCTGCVRSLWRVQVDRLGAVVPFRTPGVRQFRSSQMTHSVRLNCQEHFGSRTPSVYGATEPPGLCTGCVCSLW